MYNPNNGSEVGELLRAAQEHAYTAEHQSAFSHEQPTSTPHEATTHIAQTAVRAPEQHALPRQTTEADREERLLADIEKYSRAILAYRRKVPVPATKEDYTPSA